MRQLRFLFILFFILNACQKDYDRIKSPTKLLPSQTNSLLVINELNDFINGAENNNILSGIYIKELKTSLTILKNLNTTKPVYLAFLNEDDSDYLILAENDSTLFKVDSLPNHISETIQDYSIDKIQIDSTIFYHKSFSKFFAGSNNLELLKNLDSKNGSNVFNDLIETTNKQSVASLIFKSNSTNYSKLLFSNNELEHSSQNLTALDLNYTDNDINYNGIITSGDSVRFKIDCFKNTIPQKTNAIHLAPYDTQSLYSITYNDFSIFNKNRNLLTKQPTDSTQTLLNFTNEIALVDDALVLHSLDNNLMLESIEGKSLLETYRDIDIYQFNSPDFFKTSLAPLITFNDAEFFLVYNDFIVFSSSVESLKSIIANALNNNTLVNTLAFKSISENLTDEASIFIFKNSEGLSKILDKTIDNYNANVVQLIYEDKYAHVNGIIQKYKRRAATNTVTETFSIALDTDILSAPQTVKNHVTKAHDIAVQDINNVLHLISSSGSVLWKKQLQGEIFGKIEQIDMYKNGRLQLAFVTPNRLYILDRNGNDVSPYPLKFNDEITQPLSVFDYDKRRNYRLLVTQGKNLLMYDAKGKSVNGFRYTNNGSKILSQPKHFRIGSKDYITFSAGDKLKILNRQGKDRITVKDIIQFSDNEIYLYKNKFTTTNTLGQLVQVNTKGKLNTTNLNLPEKHSVETTSKTLVSMTENKLNIKSRTVDLDYGEYTSPRIYYLNDKIYITTTDLQSKKVYLFDSQAKPIANFPVFGTSAAELQKLDNRKGLELVTQADSKTIVVYKLH